MKLLDTINFIPLTTNFIKRDIRYFHNQPIENYQLAEKSMNQEGIRESYINGIAWFYDEHHGFYLIVFRF